MRCLPVDRALAGASVELRDRCAGTRSSTVSRQPRTGTVDVRAARGAGARGYGVRVRWDGLFADLEAQLGAAAVQDRAHEVSELTRAERATVLLVDRLRGSQGEVVTVVVRSGARVHGVLADVGSAWLLVVDGPREHLVPTGAVVSVAGLRDGAAPPEAVALRRLGLGHALRAIARDRSIVQVVTLAATTIGRIDAVGADHLDLAATLDDSGRVTGARQAIAYSGLDLVSSV